MLVKCLQSCVSKGNGCTAFFIPESSPIKENKMAKIKTIPSKSRKILKNFILDDILALGSAAKYPSAKAT